MRISSAILANSLKKKYDVQSKKTLSNKLNLEQVVFYCSGDTLKANYIYICMEEEALGNELVIPQDSLLLWCGNLENELLKKSKRIFEFPKETNPFHLLNEVQQVFDYYNQWDQKIQQWANEEGNLQEILDESFRIFHNPIIVYSTDYFVIGYSQIIDEKPELADLVNADLVFENHMLGKNSETLKNSDTEGAYIFVNPTLGVRNIGVNIFENKRNLYRVNMVESLNKFAPYHGELLDYLAMWIRTALSKKMIMETDMEYRLDRIISDVLNDKKKDVALVNSDFLEFGWLPEHEYFCINIKVSAIDLESMTTRFICQHIEKLLPFSCAFQYEQQIVVFINLTKFGGNIAEAMDSIVYFLRDCYLKAGVSNVFSGFEELYYYYKQAVIAIQTGLEVLPHVWIYRFESVALDYILDNGKGELTKNLVCSKKIQNLNEFDNIHNTDYLHTLEVYVKNHLNAVQAAKALYIHRSTFLYRMEKIKEITKLDLHHYDTLLYVMMTFRMMEKEDLK